MKHTLFLLLLSIAAQAQTGITIGGPAGITTGTLSNTTWHTPATDTIPVILLVADTTIAPFGPTFWERAYSVREKHNTSEGQVDPGIMYGCCQDYWQHTQYLTADKKAIPAAWIVWNSVEAKR